MKNNLFLGVASTLISSFSYAVLTTIVKVLGTSVATPVIVFIQSLTCFILMLGFIAVKKNPSPAPFWHTSAIRIHVFYLVIFYSLLDADLLFNMSHTHR